MLKKILLIFLIILNTNSFCYEVSPYYGIDYKNLNMEFESGYGDTTLQKNIPYVGIYYGYSVKHGFSIESGIESTIDRNKIVILKNSDVATGTPIPSLIEPIVIKSKIRIIGPYISVIKDWPLLFYLGNPIEGIGSVGVSFLQATSVRETLSIAGLPRFVRRRMIDRNIVLRGTLGAQYSPYENVKIRALIGWLNTSSLDLKSDDTIKGLYSPEIILKSSIIYGIGIRWDI